MTVSPRERRLKQMNEKGYMLLTPQQRAESFSRGFKTMKEFGQFARDEVRKALNSKAGDEPRE